MKFYILPKFPILANKLQTSFNDNITNILFSQNINITGPIYEVEEDKDGWEKLATAAVDVVKHLTIIIISNTIITITIISNTTITITTISKMIIIDTSVV